MSLVRRGHYRRLAAELEPAEEAGLRRPWRGLRRAQTLAVLLLFDMNEWAIDRWVGSGPSRWPTSRWPWIEAIERAVPQIRTEIERYLSCGTPPHVAELAGLDPSTEKGRTSVPFSAGAWREVLLYTNGRWIPETAQQFPATVAAFGHVGPKSNVGFSILEPRSHIATHRDPNRGALRFQLPIIVPGAPGQCRLRVRDDVVPWREAEALVFDLTAEHEAWNDSDGDRVLLLAELPMPLPRPLAVPNRIVQHCYRWHPSYRRMPVRVAELSVGRGAAT